MNLDYQEPNTYINSNHLKIDSCVIGFYFLKHFNVMIKVQQISKADYGVVDSPKKKCSIIELLNAVAAYQFQIQSEKKFSF